MSRLMKRIVKKIKSWNVDIHEQYDRDDVEILCTNMMILSCFAEQGLVKLLFHVAAKPDESAQVVLGLKEVKGVEQIAITDLFIYVDDLTNIITGDDAIEAFEHSIKSNIIGEFVSEQEQLHFLASCQDLPEC